MHVLGKSDYFTLVPVFVFSSFSVNVYGDFINFFPSFVIYNNTVKITNYTFTTIPMIKTFSFQGGANNRLSTRTTKF
jgi:hypothetical protein